MPLWPASGLLAPTVTPSANLEFLVIESSLPGFASELFATDLDCPPLWASTTVLFEPLTGYGYLWSYEGAYGLSSYFSFVALCVAVAHTDC